MAIEWREYLATGVIEIDNQHKELFNRINKLLDACNQGKGKEELNKIIIFLDDYIVTHFNTEEGFMTDHSYPGYSTHKSQHLRFTENFSDLKGKFEKEGAGLHLVILTNHLVVDWFINHIGKVDKELGAFLKDKM